MKKATRIAAPQYQRQRATSLRAKMTDPERNLWRALRERIPADGSHFRRQVAIGPYIVDFCCPADKLVIEVDGDQHGTDEAVAFDAKRTALIESHGFRVLRVTTFDVQLSLDVIFETVARTPIPDPSPQRGGEEPRVHA